MPPVTGAKVIITPALYNTTTTRETMQSQSKTHGAKNHHPVFQTHSLSQVVFYFLIHIPPSLSRMHPSSSLSPTPSSASPRWRCLYIFNRLSFKISKTTRSVSHYIWSRGSFLATDSPPASQSALLRYFMGIIATR